MDQTTDQPTIAKLALDCQNQFTLLCDTLRSANIPAHDLRSEITATMVEDELGRFRSWAGNIGAMTTGTASMDYRVRTAGYLRHSVKSLLEALKESLIDGSQLLDFK
jgi:hypothetical protein